MIDELVVTDHLPARPLSWLRHYGQRRNKTIMALKQERRVLQTALEFQIREIERLKMSRVVASQKYSEWSQFSAHLVHEIANPLTAASLNLEAVQGTQDSHILQARKDLAHLRRYLEAARRQLRGQPVRARFSLQTETNRVIRLLELRMRQQGISLHLQIEAGLSLFGDAVKFNQILANVLLNAIEAYDTSPNTVNRKIVTTIQQTKRNITIMVRDWGKGISNEHIVHVFEPFFSTKPASMGGLGIGLAMVKQFVEEDFNGSISVTSQATQGTYFRLRLPR